MSSIGETAPEAVVITERRKRKEKQYEGVMREPGKGSKQTQPHYVRQTHTRPVIESRQICIRAPGGHVVHSVSHSSRNSEQS
jgi:hypothetical protein